MSTKRRHLRWVPPLAVSIALVLSAGCGDDSSGPTLGNLVVTTATTGADLDPNGYTATVDNAVSQNIGTSASVTFSNLATGDYSVELTGLEDNCFVDGTNPRTVNVGTNGGATTFDVVCNSLTGNIETITSTTGVSVDPDGYTVEVDGVTSDPIGVNDTITVNDLDVGDHSVELTGVAVNCTVSGANPRIVTVPDDVPDPNGGTVQTTFAVNCVQALGDLTVQTSTTGIDLDPDGYTVTVDGTVNQPVGTNGNVTFPNLDVGSHTVLLTGIAANCSVTGNNPRTVDVQFGSNTEQFDITCQALGNIVFESDRDGNDEIYIMKADASGQTRLTSDPDIDQQPDLSTDGTRIVFASSRDISGNALDIFVMNSNGSGQTNLTNGAGSNNAAPAWSPDGSKIAFSRVSGGNRDIYVMDADGSNVARLTTDAATDDLPAWSPDGTKITFTSDRDGDLEVFVMNADGTNVLQLTTSPGVDGRPDWSPDGTKIAFTSDRSGNLDVWVMDANGSNQVNLTANAAFDGEASWSPAGTRIAFSSDRDGNMNIYVMNADGSNQTPITTDGARDSEPSWSN